MLERRNPGEITSFETRKESYDTVEIWKPLDGYNNVFQISNFKRIKRIYKHSEKILKNRGFNVGVSINNKKMCINYYKQWIRKFGCNNYNNPFEEWKDVVGFENYYQVSNLGRVRSVDRIVNGIHGQSHKNGKLKKLTLDSNGYYKTTLYKENKSRTREVQRLVAEAFIPNPNNLEEVNHINGDKANNCIDNLEWITPLENKKHSIYILGYNHKVKVNQYDLNGNYIATYESVKEAGLKNNIKPFNISLVLKNKRHRAGGYKWKYYES